VGGSDRSERPTAAVTGQSVERVATKGSLGKWARTAGCPSRATVSHERAGVYNVGARADLEWGDDMPLFLDVHQQAPTGTKAKDVADAHLADLRTQEKYGVKYINYWFDEKAGKIFCLVDAPDAETASKVHREAHGLVADEVHPVVQG
jgi:hypothetical protein